MAFPGNPRKYARDIAEGYVLLSPVQLRAHTSENLRVLKQALELDLRDVRSQAPGSDNLRAVQDRQRQILRLNQALRVIRTFALKRKIHI